MAYHNPLFLGADGYESLAPSETMGGKFSRVTDSMMRETKDTAMMRSSHADVAENFKSIPNPGAGSIGRNAEKVKLETNQ